MPHFICDRTLEFLKAYSSITHLKVVNSIFYPYLFGSFGFIAEIVCGTDQSPFLISQRQNISLKNSQNLQFLQLSS